MSESTNERLVQVLEELGIRLPYPLPAEGAHEMDQLSASTQAFYQQWADMRAERDTAIARALSAEVECKELRTQLFMMTVCAKTAEASLIEEMAKRVEAEHARNVLEELVRRVDLASMTARAKKAENK